VLNDHAVNYRKLVAQIPRDRLLVETDDDAEPAARDALLAAIWAKTVELTGITEAELDANAESFLQTLDTP
jgi:Tat protein secretion system quality control protein TatD with DNase activity